MVSVPAYVTGMGVLKPSMQMRFMTGNVAENWLRFEIQFRVYTVPRANCN